MATSPPTSRVLDILEALASSTEGLSASAIARCLSLSSSTTASILATLQQAAYVERLPDKKYQLGTGLLRLFEGLRTSHPMLGVAYDELERLSANTQCGSTLSRVGLNDIEVILSAGSIQEFDNPPGHRAPLAPPHGSLAMAWQPDNVIDDWLASAPQTISDEEATANRETLSDMRELGYAVYSVEQDARTLITQMHKMLDELRSDSMPETFRTRLNYLSTGIGVSVYPKVELEKRKDKSVSFIIAPAFGPDGQPRYLVTLHLMRDNVKAVELDTYIEELSHSATVLTDNIGGKYPT